jgi:hypothetical protein
VLGLSAAGFGNSSYRDCLICLQCPALTSGGSNPGLGARGLEPFGNF